MSYFSPEFPTFFAELTENNHKEWFDANRKRYEQHVKKPFSLFVGALIEAIAAFEPTLEIKPKDAIFRINRDIRFSPDKTPYKVNRSAAISENGRKAQDVPMYYIQIGAEKLYVGGGCYGPSKSAIAAIRSEMAAEPEALKKLLDSSDFKKAYGTLQGAENKVLPKEYKEAAQKQPLIYKKSFYYMTELPLDAILFTDDVVERVVDMYKIGKPMNDYLRHAMAG